MFFICEIFLLRKFGGPRFRTPHGGMSKIYLV